MIERELGLLGYWWVRVGRDWLVIEIGPGLVGD